MRKKLNRGLAIFLSALTLISSVPVYATEVEHQHTSESSNQETTVLYNQDSNFSITIPKNVSLDNDKTSAYTVTVTGDISSDEIIKVVPDDSFLMKDISGSQSPKDDVEATVEQDKTEWIFNEFDTIGNGMISAENLTSGTWQGSFYFNISLEKEEIIIENPLQLTVDSIHLDAIAMGTGSQQQLTASIEGEDITDMVEWESDNSEKITVTEGLVETTAAAKVGDSATITATFEVPQTFATTSESNIYSTNITVTIIDIIYTEVGGSEIITEIDIIPGKSKQIEATIIPGSVQETVSWTTTAISGINLLTNGNQVTVKVASDMEVGQSYYVAATCGSLIKLVKINVVADHICEYEKTVITEATCTTDGLALYECIYCNASYNAALIATGHNELTIEGFAATCTTTGLTDGTKCSICDTVFTEQEIVPAVGHLYSDWNTSLNPTCTVLGSKKRSCIVCGNTETENISPIGHNYTETIVEPTCIAQGYTIHTCSNCGDNYKDTYIDAIGHNYSEWITTQNPTCTETGTQSRTCESCGNTETKNIAVLGHNYNNVITNPTCTLQGYTTHTCSNCGDSYKDTYIAALGHTEETIKGYAATCTTSGLTDGVKCSICDITITKQSVISAMGHTYSDWNTSLNPTCTVVGSQNRTCSICGNVETKEVAVLGHNWETDYTIDKAATCTETGSKSIHCTRCNVIKDITTIPAAGHSSVNGGTENTHTKCSVCNTTLSAIHNMTSIITKNATCTTTGIKTYSCECGYNYTDTIPATGHNSVNGGTSDAHIKCSICGVTLTTVHSYTSTITTEATCTTDGEKTHTCSCGYSYIEAISAKDHSYSSTYSTNSTQHWKECVNGCGIKAFLANHADNGTDGLCDICGYKGTIVYTYHAHTGNSSEGGGCYSKYIPEETEVCGIYEVCNGGSTNRTKVTECVNCNKITTNKISECVLECNECGNVLIVEELYCTSCNYGYQEQGGFNHITKLNSAYYELGCGKTTSTVESQYTKFE